MSEKYLGYEKYEDAEIIQACVAGEKDAFAELVVRYKNLIYSVVLRMVSDGEEANDLAQEIFIKIYKNLEKYSDEFKFSTWTIKIATNHVIDYRRKKKQETVSIEAAADIVAEDGSPEEIFLAKEQNLMLKEVLENLPDMYRIPIVLYHQQGLSYQEISEITQEPLSKVKNRIFRGRKMLKENLMSLRGENYGV